MYMSTNTQLQNISLSFKTKNSMLKKVLDLTTKQTAQKH
jgi:hypothetical protein